MAFLLLQCKQHLVGKLNAAFTALFPDLGKCKLTSAFSAELLHVIRLRFCVCDKGVQGNHNRHTELLQVLNMLLQVDNPLLQCIQILCAKIRFRHAAVVFECTHGCNQHNGIRCQSCFPALDIEEFFSAEICAKAGLRNHIIREL